ncbi:MAG: ATP-binding protein [Pyrinomonadaceae bacterium]
MRKFSRTNQGWMRFGGAFLSIALITFLLEPFHAVINTATIALTFLLLILFIATFLGRNPALIASVAAMLCFNYFFLPPVRALTIAEPQNLIAWAAFMITAVTAGELSAYAKRRAEEAEKQKREIERLYDELKTAFAKASEAEGLRQSEKLKSALLDAVTHDLRTPLTSIKVLATTLLDSEGGHRTIELDSESKHEFLETIVGETDRLNQFIEGMVELAQIEAGSIGLRRGWDEVSEIIEAALFRAEKLLQNRRILLKLEENLPLVQVDSKSLAEVIYTLLDNAAKYSPDNSNIEIAAHNTGQDTIEISITDEGEGVPVEWREKIFDKFFRVEETAKSTKKPKGMGLGLAIAKGIIEAHGGKIRVTDNPNGQGAKFVLTVPIGDE